MKYEFLDHPGLPVIEDPWLDNALSYLRLYEVREARKSGREHAGHFGRWEISECSRDGWYTISDSLLKCESRIHRDLLHNAELDLGRWYEARVAEQSRRESPVVWDGVAVLRVLFEPYVGGLERGLDKLASRELDRFGAFRGLACVGIERCSSAAWNLPSGGTKRCSN